MRKVGFCLTAAAFVLAVGGPARAEDKPTPGSEPGSTEPSQPDPAYVLDVEKVTLRVDGKAVEAAPPGVEVDVTIMLHNFSKEIVRGVKASLVPSSGYRTVDADATYGDIAPDDSADGAFAIVIPREGCPDFLGIGGEITYDGDTSPLKVGIPTACPGPRLYIEDVRFEGGDGDGVPEPGETLRAFVILRNDGRDAADNVGATVKVSGDGVTTASDDLTWPDIAPGGSAKSREAITVKISDDAKRQDACPGPPRDGGVVVSEQPPTDTGTVSPETPVSSDGSTGSSGNASSEPGSSAPGSVGSGSSGSTGTEPTTVEPAPPVTSTVEPLPAPAPEETVKPEPAPEQDRPVLLQMHLAITATDYTGQQDYSTGVFCALAEGGGPGIPASGAPEKTLAARDTAARSSRGSTALPIAFAVLISAAAVGARRALTR